MRLVVSLRLMLFSALGLTVGLPVGHAQFTVTHQTPTVTPLEPASALSYQISVREYDFGIASLPTLHSYAVGEYDGKWILLAGRTNGLHGFEQSGSLNFPPEFQNRDIWVIDPVTRESWSRSLEDASSGLTAAEIAALTPTNNQFSQIGDRLYMTGGYGVDEFGGPGTFATLSALDLPGIVDWVTTGSGQATDHIRQTTDPQFSVTGGAMYEMGGKLHQVFGQDFQGGYNPTKEGTYTKQVRSFEIVDDGTTLSFQNSSATPQVDAYRRRDLNVFPVVRPSGGGGTEEGLVVLSGVFTEGFGAWTVPVEIDAAGIPTMADPTAPSTFKQGFNGYHSAKLGLYSQANETMHEILFGGISLQTFNMGTGVVETDDALPFVNDITAVMINSAGTYSQHHLGAFPEILDLDGKQLRFGANAEFFAAEGIVAFDNGVIDLDELQGETTLGYIFGGITANGPHTRGEPTVISAATNRIFEVVLLPVPEPSGLLLASCGLLIWLGRRRCPR